MDILRKQIKAFLYLPKPDCFVVAPELQGLCDKLHLTEWSAVVWMGRLFARDQDFGEHWFDNWEEREELEGIPEGMDEEQMMIVVPERFTQGDCYCIHCFDPPVCNEVEHYRRLPCPKCGKDIHVGPDGPCYPDKVKKLFWTDVLDSLHISLNTLFELARDNNLNIDTEDIDVEKEIKEITQAYEF